MVLSQEPRALMTPSQLLTLSDVVSQHRLEECRRLGRPAYVMAHGSRVCSIVDKWELVLDGSSSHKARPAWLPEKEVMAGLMEFMMPPGLQREAFRPPPGLSREESFEPRYVDSSPEGSVCASDLAGEDCIFDHGKVSRANTWPEWPTAEGAKDGFFHRGRAHGATAEGNTAHGPKQQRPHHRPCRLLIAEALNKLHDEDPYCIVYVWQIHRLGFGSAEILREHFEQFGPVRDVLLSNAHERLDSVPDRQRVRPSRIGFVLMQDPQAAVAAIAAGPTQTVRQQCISVRKFEPRSRHDAEEYSLPAAGEGAITGHDGGDLGKS
mmetsp:Transcript_44891/g.139684  ORF Transcript_44891/g.139684 Transcript_44891/m.139684 type:complete len:322 (-) Transcript_44891:111-1076(-)